MEFIFSSHNAIFLGAIYVVLAIGAIELIALLTLGTSLSHGFDSFAGLDHFPDHFATNWLMFKELPLMAVIVLFLGGFGAVGLTTNGLTGAYGISLPTLLVFFIAFIGGIVSLKMLGTLVKPVFRTETDAVSRTELVGLQAVLKSPFASVEKAGEASVVDHRGTVHHVMVIPEAGSPNLKQGQNIRLIRIDGHRFQASPIQGK